MGSLGRALGDARGCYVCRAPGERLCAGCAADQGPPVVDEPIRGIARVIAPWEYAAVPRSLILDLKVRGQRAAAEPLIAGMVRELRRNGTSATWIAWVPGRPPDTRRRGFDHAHLLAIGVAAATGLPLIAALTRVGYQQDQAGLGRAARLANLRQAFRATSCPEQVLLVDDLVTTGATASACAHALRRGGAHSVELVVACRA
jgi:predicted amidophosphoribosyltransferase